MAVSSSEDTAAPGVVASPAVEAVRANVTGDFLPPLPLATTSFGAAADGETVYALGGYAGEPHEYNGEEQSPWLYRLAPGGEWEQRSRLPYGLQGLVLVPWRGGVCRFGGNRFLNRRTEDTVMRSVPDAACFDPASNTWSDLPPLAAGRSSFDGARIGNVVYLAGGWTLNGTTESAAWSDHVAALDLGSETPEWRTIPAPFRRRALAVAAWGEKLVIVGGLTRAGELSPRVDVYDAARDSWSQGPDFPGNAFGVAATSADGSVYASGADGEIYRLSLAGWEKVGSLAFGRFFHQLVSRDGELLALGGISGMHTRGRTRHVERMPLDNAAAGAVSVIEIDYPGRAKNRQAVFVIDDDLYFFGGNRSLGQHDFAPEDFLSEGWRLHLPSLSWERQADFPARRQTMQVVVRGGRAIVAGGFGHDGEAAVTQPEIYAYEPEADEWQSIGVLNTSRTQFGFVAHEENLWMFGGLNYDPARPGQTAFEHLTTTLRASVPVEEGESVAELRTSFLDVPEAPLPGPRRAFAGAADNGRYYLIGGMKDGFGLVDDCLAFDFDALRYQATPCPARPRLSGDLVPHEGRLYLVGGSVRGEEGMESSLGIEVFDPSDTSTEWEVWVDALPFDTRHARALTYGYRILVISTHNEEGVLRLAFVRPASGS